MLFNVVKSPSVKTFTGMPFRGRAQVRAHIIAKFLNVDEVTALREAMETMHQSTYETDASFNRHFRDLAEAAFHRNEDQQCILVQAYAHGLRSTTSAIKMIKQANPRTLSNAMAWVAQFSKRTDAVQRLGLSRSNEARWRSAPFPNRR